MSVSFYRGHGEAVRGPDTAGVSRYRDTGEWIRAATAPKGELLQERDPDA